MHPSTAVFLAFTVIYFGSLVVPFEFAAKAFGWTTQATALSAAVATFFLLKQEKMDMSRAAMVLACMAMVSILSALAIMACVQRGKCKEALPVHTLVFSTGFLSGAAAYIAFLLTATVGMPLWATIVAAAIAAPLFVGYVMPFFATHIEKMFSRVE
jgi:hypothetical protein